MRYLKFIPILLLALILQACPYTGFEGYEFSRGKLPANPVNMEVFNTEFDDYNMTAPSLGRYVPFCFSTNRHAIFNFFIINNLNFT